MLAWLCGSWVRILIPRLSTCMTLLVAQKRAEGSERAELHTSWPQHLGEVQTWAQLHVNKPFCFQEHIC